MQADSKHVVEVANLTKVFQIWKRPSDMLMEAITGRQRHTNFTALRNVSFNVPRGAIVGILGRNGAGKSTLLRIIAGTLDASSGTVSVNGRIAAILELGTGFHPEYSGRENVVLGGLCLGLSRKEINEKFDEIVAFSELEEFIDQPFRTYSSGMQARLTFAVATSVDPDVLIVDEALSVGDAKFALKSFDRIRQFAARNKSILFVSHDINQVMTFCDEAVMLERGEVFAKGDPRTVGNIYHRYLFGEPKSALPESLASANDAKPAPHTPPAATTALNAPVIVPSEPLPAAATLSIGGKGPGCAHQADGFSTGLFSKPVNAIPPLDPRNPRYGDQKVIVEDFFLHNGFGEPMVQLETLQPYQFYVRLKAFEDVNQLTLGIRIRNQRGVEAYSTDSSFAGGVAPLSLRAGQCASLRVHFVNHLAPGHYFVSTSLARLDGHKHDLRPDFIEFVVAAQRGIYSNSITNLNARIRFEAV